MPRFERTELLKKFRAMVARGVPILGGGAGTGLSAKCEEAGGIDLIVIYNSGRYRMAGRGSLAGLLAYGNAHDVVVDLIRAAHELDLLTTPYVFEAEQAREMTKAGADIVVCHMGLTTGGAIGAQTALTLDDCIVRVNDWATAARRVRKDVIVLCHGGPIAQPADAAYVIDRCPDCHGFFGASSMERLPTEVAIAEQTRQFKRIERRREAARVGAP